MQKKIIVLACLIFFSLPVVTHAKEPVLTSQITEEQRQEAQQALDLAISQFEKGDYRQAIANYSKAIDIVPELPQPYYNRGLAYFQQGDLDEAIADYDKAIQLDHNYAQAYGSRGSAYFFKNDLQQSLTDYDRAIEVNPQDALFYGQRSGVLIEQGKYDEAILDLNKALEINPGLGEAYVNLAVVNFRIKDYEKSWANVKIARQLGAGDFFDPGFLEELQKASGRAQ